MKSYYFLCVVIYFISKCYGKCSDYYVILERIDINNYTIADMTNIDIFTHPYNNSEEFKEIQQNKDCLITKNVIINECHTGYNNAELNGMIPIIEDSDHDNSKKIAIIVTSVTVASGILVFAVKKLLIYLQQDSYYLPEPNTSV